MDCLAIAQRLIEIDSVTSRPNAKVAGAMLDQLTTAGFSVESIEYNDNAGLPKVALIGRRGPQPKTARGGIVYCCHNDVVAVDGWNGPYGGPFDPVVADGRLWGRGACDMKGSAAAALAAVCRIPVAQQTAPIYFLVTGDEESGMQGARTIVEQSKFFSEMIEFDAVGIIGEPTELQVVNTHKGGCHLHIHSNGVAAHSSTADGHNANWQLIPFLSYLHGQFHRTENDSALQNSLFSPSTLSMNVVIKNEPAASNITVGKAVCQIFIRPMPDTNWRQFADDIMAQAIHFGLQAKTIIALDPLHTPAHNPFVQNVLEIVQQTEPKSVCYATDGCSLKVLPNLLVLGPGSIEQAHRPDEWISLDQLLAGVDTYERIFKAYAT
jgi:acetylornithine deacetylase